MHAWHVDSFNVAFLCANERTIYELFIKHTLCQLDGNLLAKIQMYTYLKCFAYLCDFWLLSCLKPEKKHQMRTYFAFNQSNSTHSNIFREMSNSDRSDGTALNGANVYVWFIYIQTTHAHICLITMVVPKKNIAQHQVVSYQRTILRNNHKLIVV